MLESDGPAATERAGARLAAELAPGDVVHVAGELGAGKTTFVRGACRALGVTVAGDEPDVRDRAPLPGGRRRCASRTSTSTGSSGPATRIPTCSRDYLDADTIAFVEWPRDGRRRAAAAAPDRDARATSAAIAAGSSGRWRA